MKINILKRKQVLASKEEVNQILSFKEYYGLTVIKLGNGQPYKSLEAWKNAYGLSKVSLSQYMIIDLKDTKIEITTRYYEKYFKFGTPCTYIFDLNGEDIFSQSGIDCFKEFSKAYKIPKAVTYNYERLDKWYDTTTNKYICSARPILDFNEKYEKKELTDCYEYDLNSAYASVLLDKIPDLYHPIIAEWPDLVKVNKDEIGFMIDDQLTMVNSGGYADIKFKLIDTPQKLKDFLMKWYNIKKTSIGIEKLQAKAMLNLPIGYCQRYNPFLRSYVVSKCNEVIKAIIDDDTLFWNTDAIFSKKRRPELELGLEIGQFKEIKCNKLAYIGNIYQINDEDPTYRGISKAWFTTFEKENGRKYDLLKDYSKKINRINRYNLDWNKLKLKETEYEEEII